MAFRKLKATLIDICDGRDFSAQTRNETYADSIRKNRFWGFVARVYTDIITTPVFLLSAIPIMLFAFATSNKNPARILLAPLRVMEVLAKNLTIFMMKHSFALKVATLGLALALSFGLLVAFPPAGIVGAIGFGGQLAATLGLASLNVGLYATVISALTFAATSVLGGLAYLAKKCFVCSNEKTVTNFRSSQANMQSGLEIDEYVSHSTAQKSKRGTKSCFISREKESSHVISFHKKTNIPPLNNDNVGNFVADQNDNRLKIQ